jgi:hypothetical protein
MLPARYLSALEIVQRGSRSARPAMKEWLLARMQGGDLA